MADTPSKVAIADFYHVRFCVMVSRVRSASVSICMVSRFLVILAALCAATPAMSAETEYARVSNWASVSDPLRIVISLDKQHLTLYRGTEKISSTRVSTGKRGHSTPAGIFSILQKRRWHRSNIYSNAPMPYMQRLTWSGVALHQGYVPNYPASHGCIRLPGKYARKLFSMTDLGVQVLITRGEAKPEAIFHTKLLRPRPLHLVTMDERDVMLQWAEDDGRPRRWIPLPARAPMLQTVSYSAVETSATVDEKLENAAPPAKRSGQSVEREASLKLANLEYDLEQVEFYQNRSVEPLRILITHREGAGRVRDVQKLLRKLGHNPGDIDGYVGRDTRAAIRSFQEAHGIEVTGELTDELVQRVFKEAKSSPPPSGHIYVKQDHKLILDAPISIANSDKPLGTHLFSVMNFDIEADDADWQVISADDEADAREVLDRISFSDDLRDRLERLMTPGSTIIISDGGLNPETNEYTDFIVVMN